MVGKFRMFENIDLPDSKDALAGYLAINTTQPLTKNEMMEYIALKSFEKGDMSKLFRVKRCGKDRDEMFWSFGKIHGLENIAFADPAEVKATNGNPVKI
jgi:hypothetical protein